MLRPILLSGVGAFGNPHVESGATQLMPKSIYDLKVRHQPNADLNQAIVTRVLLREPIDRIVKLPI